MKGPHAKKLRQLGLDINFLCWLEGREQRLPDIDAIRKVKDAEFAGAIRAAEYLRQREFDVDLIAPISTAEWGHRYQIVEEFLWGCLLSTTFHSVDRADKDLETFERVLKKLLPQSLWKGLDEDIRRLRRQGLPEDFKNPPTVKRGGKRESEETARMRAAIQYVGEVSKTPFADLAAVWNEYRAELTASNKGGAGSAGRTSKTAVYHPDGIKQRLRSGHELTHGTGTAERLLESWQDIYSGELQRASPGRFPLSSEIEAALKEGKVRPQPIPLHEPAD